MLFFVSPIANGALGPSGKCLTRKAILYIEDNSIGARAYIVNKCTKKIKKLLFKDRLEINLVSKIYDGKSIVIPQDLHDLILNYFKKTLGKLAHLKINQRHFLISEIIRMAQNAPSFINNLEKSTKTKINDKTANQTIDMIVLSVINNLKKKKSEQLTLNNNLMLFNLTKRKILLKSINKKLNKKPDFFIQSFSSISLEKFIKKDIFHWSKLSLNKSVNPIGSIKIKNVLETYLLYLKNKIPSQFVEKKTSFDNTKPEYKLVEYTNYQNKKNNAKPVNKKDTLIVTGDTIISSLKSLKIRGNWLRRDTLKRKIETFANYQDNKIPSSDPRFTAINLILLYGHMTIMGYEKAYIQPSSFEEGFLLHPDYY